MAPTLGPSFLDRKLIHTLEQTHGTYYYYAWRMIGILDAWTYNMCFN